MYQYIQLLNDSLKAPARICRQQSVLTKPNSESDAMDMGSSLVIIPVRPACIFGSTWPSTSCSRILNHSCRSHVYQYRIMPNARLLIMSIGKLSGWKHVILLTYTALTDPGSIAIGLFRAAMSGLWPAVVLLPGHVMTWVRWCSPMVDGPKSRC